MAKYKDFDIRERTAEELFKLGDSTKEICQKLGCSRRQLYEWQHQDSAPSAFYLASFHRAGCDVIYILTGERTR